MENIKIDITILKPVQTVWQYFIEPKHITRWNFANDNWHCPKADSDFREGGKFSYRMEAKDGSFGFDYTGTFVEIVPEKLIKYRLDDGRNVEVYFNSLDAATTEVVEIFEPEPANSREMQRDGWYAILNNFHKYVENH